MDNSTWEDFVKNFNSDSSTTPTPLEQFKSGWNKGIDQSVETFGFASRSDVYSYVISGLVTSWAMWRNSRRGNVARTVAYGVSMINQANHLNSRRIAAAVERSR